MNRGSASHGDDSGNGQATCGHLKPTTESEVSGTSRDKLGQAGTERDIAGQGVTERDADLFAWAKTEPGDPMGASVISALFVETKGIYAEHGFDVWGVERDARTYAGPNRVIAHPPCERWGRYWSGGPSAKVRRKLGDDGGCFASAIASVRRWGGVLEHPEASHAWRAFGLPKPPRAGGWIATPCGGWTCCVEQGHYGHRARKATWLYANGVRVPELQWGPSAGKVRRDVERLSKKERVGTPLAFMLALLSIASYPEAQAA